MAARRQLWLLHCLAASKLARSVAPAEASQPVGKPSSKPTSEQIRNRLAIVRVGSDQTRSKSLLTRERVRHSAVPKADGVEATGETDELLFACSQCVG